MPNLGQIGQALEALKNKTPLPEVRQLIDLVQDLRKHLERLQRKLKAQG